MITRTLLVIGLSAASMEAHSMDLSYGNRTAGATFHDESVTALVESACKGDVKGVNAAIAGRANLNLRGEEGITPLIWAMGCASRKVIELLLDAGADPNEKMNNGNSPVYLAAARDDPELLRSILRHHGNPNIKTREGRFPLQVAVLEQREANIDLLLQADANVNEADNRGQSAALAAVVIGRFDLAVRLVRHGYTRDLKKLAKAAEIRTPSPDQARFKSELTGLLN